MAQDEFTKLFNHMNKRFDKLEKQLDNNATKKQLDNLIVTIDGFLKRLDNIEADNMARDLQYARHDRWIHQLANKTGIELKT